jgi:hypothetical protein
MNVLEVSQQSLTRAVSGQSMANYGTIIEGFAARGIPVDEILPRENVFTFWAWKALGRRVKKGEHGVKATTFVPVAGKKDVDTGAPSPGYRMPRAVTVFHISQTEIDSQGVS